FKSSTYTKDGSPNLRISNIQDGTIDLNDLVFTDRKDYKENLGQYEVRYGDLLIAMSGGTTGKVGTNNTDQLFLLNQRVGKFIPSGQLLKSYLHYYLTTKVEESLKIAAGSAQPNLSTEQIKNFLIPLAPIAEQNRIVAILDEAFAAIDKAKA